MPEASGNPSQWSTLLRPGTLGRRILLWFLVLSLFPLLFSNALGYLVTRGIQGREVDRFMRALTATQAAHVTHGIDRNQLVLSTLVAAHQNLWSYLPSATEEVRTGRPGPGVAAMSRGLARELAEFQDFDDLIVLDSSGMVVAATSAGWLHGDWGARKVFRDGSRGPALFAERMVDSTGTHPLTVSARPLRDHDEVLRGVLVGITRFDRLRVLFRILPHVAGYVETFIVSGEGYPLLVSQLDQEIDFGRPLLSPLVQAAAGEVRQYVNGDGVEVVGTVAPIPGTSWLCITEAPTAQIFRPLRRLGVLSAVAGSLFALILVGIVWLVARSIVRPLGIMVAGADQIREGNLGIQLPEGRDDELGQLVRTFNQMSLELAQSQKKILDLHEAEMRRADQLATVGELASGIAHEVKNPLAGIASGLSLLDSHLREDSRSRNTLAQLRTQLRRMENAINDLLSYARPKPPRTIRLHPGQLIDRTLQLVSPLAQEAGVALDSQVANGVAPVTADPEQLTQALVNLAINGIQATPAGGHVVLGVTSCDDRVCLFVADDGGGIPAERLEDIFRPFVTTKHKGSGLGLAITRGIVERNGGSIEVASEVGHGSRFTLILPATSTGPSS